MDREAWDLCEYICLNEEYEQTVEREESAHEGLNGGESGVNDVFGSQFGNVLFL